MKCPKCGYNSFESYDLCIKCSHDLTAHKATYGLKPIVLQAETRATMATELAAKTSSDVASQAAPEQSVDLFSFDLPDEGPAAPAGKEAVKEDVFSFGEKTAAPPSELFNAFSFDDDQAAGKPQSEEDVFSSLLEPTQQGSAASHAAPEATQPASAQNASQGEYELSDFSWDDNPEVANPENKKPAEDFKSIFGEIDIAAKK